MTTGSTSSPSLKHDRIECPKCRSTMQPVHVGETAIDRCGKCGGLWLDVFEKDAVVAHKGGAAQADPGDARQPAKAPRVMHCPLDGYQLISMVDRAQPHVRFEACNSCGGIFLDAGELRDLSEHTLAERVRTLFNRKA